MKKPITIGAMMLFVGLFTYQSANAQTYVVEETMRITMDDEDQSREAMRKIVTEIFENVYAKSEILLGHSMRRHAWGSEGSTVVVSWEVATFSDIEKFTQEEMEKLSVAAWPDEKVRDAKWEEYQSYFSPYHKDEIYMSFNDIRGYAKPQPETKK